MTANILSWAADLAFKGLLWLIFFGLFLAVYMGTVKRKGEKQGAQRGPQSTTKVVTVKANASSIHKKMQREIAKQQRQGWSVVSAQVENSGWMVPSATIVLKR